LEVTWLRKKRMQTKGEKIRENEEKDAQAKNRTRS
jgi:hypothetical protein